MPAIKTTPSFINLPYKLERAAPRFESNAIKYPEALVRYFLKLYTKTGDKVFDPFAGLGTTLFMAEALKRVPFGIEADRQRYEWVAGQLAHWQNLRHADSAKLAKLSLPQMDFCMASPPFMQRSDTWNPLFAGDPAKAGYAAYLKRLGFIYGKVAGQMKRGGIVVLHADNIPGRAYTPLVHDIATAVGKSLTLKNEVTIAWTGGRKDYAHTQCLIFQA